MIVVPVTGSELAVRLDNRLTPPPISIPYQGVWYSVNVLKLCRGAFGGA